MRKNALKITLITAVAGIFGAFIRWLQDLNAFEADTGLAIPGAPTTIAMTVFLLLAAALFALLAVRIGKACEFQTGPSAFRASTRAPEVVFTAAGVVTALASAVLLLFAGAEKYPMLTRVFAVVGIFAGVALPFVPERKKTGAPGKGGAALAVVLFLCVWLILAYKNNAENPVVWSYCVEILAVGAALMGYYEFSAYFYGRAKPRWALFFLQLAAFLNIATLADGRGLCMKALFFVSAAVMLLLEFLLVENLSGKK